MNYLIIRFSNAAIDSHKPVNAEWRILTFKQQNNDKLFN